MVNKKILNKQDFFYGYASKKYLPANLANLTLTTGVEVPIGARKIKAS